jgi:hypothetical protein
VQLAYYENGTFMDRLTDCYPDGIDCATWNRYRCSEDAPPIGATSVCVLLAIHNTLGTGTYGTAFDGIKVMPVSIFADGFESGDVSQWSGHVP